VDLSQSPLEKATWPAWGITADGQTLYLAWSDGRDASQNIYYAKSSDGGESWASAQRVWETSLDSLRPDVVVPGTTAILSWAERTLYPHHEVYEMALEAGSPVLVPNDRTGLAYVSHLALGPGGELHLALQGGTKSQPDILYSRRDAEATTWPTATVVFTHTASGSFNPALAVSDSGTVHLMWQENSFTDSTIHTMRGQSSGPDIAWGSPITLSAGITSSVRPAVALGIGTVVYVAWGEKAPDLKNQYVRFARSEDGGATWSDPERIDPERFSVNSVAPTDVAPSLVVAPSGTVCVAWHGFRPGAQVQAEEIYVTCSADQGKNWPDPVNVSRSPGIISLRPVVAVGSGGILHLAWQEYVAKPENDPRYHYQIYYAHSMPYTLYLPTIQRSHP